jgi:hypothetical protein
MRRSWAGVKVLGLLVGALLSASSSAVAQPAADAASVAGDLSWPRGFQTGNQQLEVYQPQIESWQGDRIAGRAAIAVGPKDGAPTYGVAHFTARASVDKTAGIVTLNNMAIDKVDVPTAPAQAQRLQALLQQQIPATGMTTALDHLQTSYAVSQQVAKDQNIMVRNDPPRIVFSAQPTVVAPVDGTPALATVQGSPGFQRVINTRALILQDQAGAMYVNAAGFWYQARTLEGPWLVLTVPPATLLEAAKAASAATPPDPLLPPDGKPPPSAPALLVATQPVELVLTTGQPEIAPVDGTSLLTMTNADHAVFIVAATNEYYVLVSGRWFKGKDMNGPWIYAPGSTLPADFARISVHDPKANVLVSVPGTPQAKEAAIAVTVPQTATVSRTKAVLDVTYAGPPRFEPIAGTKLSYAVNTPTPVIEVARDRLYAVAEGVWFVAANPNGPWRVADTVPEAIYGIPPSSPLHYVTYVRVYSSTPEDVVVGYTLGYMGVVIDQAGAVVYGTGYYYPPYLGGGYWYGYPATYGYGAGFALGAAEGFAFGFAAGDVWGAASPYWGPYWGYRGGYVNWQHVNVNHINVYGRWGEGSITHVSGWSSWSGGQWSGSHVAGFNPYSGTRFQGSRGGEFNWRTGGYVAGREGSFSNASTGSFGAARGGVAGNVRTGNYDAGRESAGYNANTDTAHASKTTVSGNTMTGQRDVDSKGIAVNKDAGGGVAWNNGNIYADHDGNVYQHSDQGWQKRTSDGWQRSNDRRATDDLDRERTARATADQRFDDQARRGAFDENRFAGDRRGGERESLGGGERFGGRGGGFHRR